MFNEVRTRRMFRVVFLSVPLCLISNLVPFSPSLTALANGSCSGLLSPHNFDGAHYSGGYGAKAWINVRDASFCTQNSTSPNHISAWVGVGSSDNSEDIAQAGYRKTTDTPSWLEFLEYSDHNGNYDEESYGSALSNGTNISYEVGYDSFSHLEYMTADGTHEIDTNFNPIGDWDGPWSMEYLGEVYDSGDEMPGTSTAKTRFSSMAYQSSTSCCPTSFSTLPSYSTTHDQGNVHGVDSTTVDIWHS